MPSCHPYPITKTIDPRTKISLSFMKVILCNFKVWEINLRLQPSVPGKNREQFLQKWEPPWSPKGTHKLTALLGKRPSGSGELKRLQGPSPRADLEGSVPGLWGSGRLLQDRTVLAASATAQEVPTAPDIMTTTSHSHPPRVSKGPPWEVHQPWRKLEPGCHRKRLSV